MRLSVWTLLYSRPLPDPADRLLCPRHLSVQTQIHSPLPRAFPPGPLHPPPYPCHPQSLYQQPETEQEGRDYYRPHPKEGEGNVFTGVRPFTLWGYPSPRYFPRSLVPGPFLGRGVYPSPGRCGTQSQVGGTPVPAARVPQDSGIPLSRTRGTPIQDGTGVPPPPVRTGLRYPSPPADQDSRASTCYAAGGMPLAVTQEDFLV